MPSPLGIVTVHSDQLSDLGRTIRGWHTPTPRQAGSVTERVYDRNRGQNDDLTIRFETGRPAEATTFTHNPDIDDDVRRVFRSTYTPQPPPTG